MKMIRNLVKNGIQKLRERAGETIVETLVSMLIVVMSFTMLAGAIVAAARVNAGAANQTLYLNEADTANITEAGTVVIKDASGNELVNFADRKKVKSYDPPKDAGTLYYYE